MHPVVVSHAQIQAIIEAISGAVDHRRRVRHRTGCHSGRGGVASGAQSSCRRISCSRSRQASVSRVPGSWFAEEKQQGSFICHHRSSTSRRCVTPAATPGAASSWMGGGRLPVVPCTAIGLSAEEQRKPTGGKQGVQCQCRREHSSRASESSESEASRAGFRGRWTVVAAIATSLHLAIKWSRQASATYTRVPSRGVAQGSCTGRGANVS